MTFGSTPRRGTLLPLLSVGSLDHYTCVVCSSEPVTVQTHFMGRTLVCPGEPECGLCDLGKPTTWYGYLACERDSKQFLLRITASSLGRCKLSHFSCGAKLVLHRKSLRRPIRIEISGKADVRRQVRYLELLHVVAKVHLLPSVRMDESRSSNEDRLRRAAIQNCRSLLPQE